MHALHQYPTDFVYFPFAKEASYRSKVHICLVCGFFGPTRESFTHLKTSPLPVNGCKFCSMLGTHGH